MASRAWGKYVAQLMEERQSSGSTNSFNKLTTAKGINSNLGHCGNK